MQDSQQHAHMNHFISSLLSALTVAPQSVPTTAPTIHLAQMGNNPNLLQAKCVTSVPNAPVRVYSGNPKIILPIILDLMTDKTNLVAEDDSELVFESIKFLTHNYTFNQQQPADDVDSNAPCRTCDGCKGCDAEVEPVEDDEHDSVYNPSHYQLPGLNGLEVMDVRSSLLQTIPEGVPYELVTSWNESWTYLTRMWGKNGLEDAKKAQVYLSRLIELWEQHNHSH